MPTIRIKGRAVAEHQAMHTLGLHHNAPELIEVGGMLVPAENGYTVFTTRERPEQLAARIRQQVPEAGIEVKGFFGWWKV